MSNPGDSIVPKAAVNTTGSDPHGSTRVPGFTTCQNSITVDERKTFKLLICI